MRAQIQSPLYVRSCRTGLSVIELLLAFTIIFVLLSVAGLLGGGRSEEDKRPSSTKDLVAQLHLVLQDNPHLASLSEEPDDIAADQIVVTSDHLFYEGSVMPDGATWQWLQDVTSPMWQRTTTNALATERRPVLLRKRRGDSLYQGVQLGGLQTKSTSWRFLPGMQEEILCDAWGQAVVIILGGNENPVVLSFGPDGVPGSPGPHAFWATGAGRGSPADIGTGDDIVKP